MRKNRLGAKDRALIALGRDGRDPPLRARDPPPDPQRPRRGRDG
ncbi:hypothetical protein ACU4GR_22670 [Methylobacterium oryzae CBMB20]